MKPECAELAELLSALADGELPEADRGRVEAHLRDCAECRALAERLRRLDAAVAAGLNPPTVSAERWDRMLDAIKRAGRVRQAAVLKAAPVRRVRFAAWAAAAAAVLVAAVLLLPGRGPAGAEYSSAESIVLEPSGGDSMVTVRLAPEGGLRLVCVTMLSDSEPSERGAGG
jgi:anti-sigma factor RsiW